MKGYIDLVQDVLDWGTSHTNRTGIDTIRTTGASIQINLRHGFPAVTTKKLAFKAVVGELVGFINGYTNASDFERAGCGIWRQNADENEAWLKNRYRKGPGDLGPIYGAQWRGHTNGHDQLGNAIRMVIEEPDSRRNIVSAWNVTDLHKMALPPCHVMFQLIVDKESNCIDMCVFQRSCDVFLGLPFNIASYALLLELIAKVTGKTANTLHLFLGDVHIYKNHFEQCRTQIAREPFDLPEINFKGITPHPDNWLKALQELCKFNIDNVELINYEHHDTIKAEMAV